MQTQRIISFAAWTVLTFIAFATLSPYSLRPELTETEPGLVVLIEHVGAFGLLGFLFIVSYPERRRVVCLVVLGSAIALELAQILLPDRHARLADALEKIVGGGAGILLGISLLPALIEPGGLFSRIDRQSFAFNPRTVASEFLELALGFVAIVLFALALVIFQNLSR
jgi:VanZ family protein